MNWSTLKTGILGFLAGWLLFWIVVGAIVPTDVHPNPRLLTAAEQDIEDGRGYRLSAAGVLVGAFFAWIFIRRSPHNMN